MRPLKVKFILPGSDRGDEPVLAPDQILAVPAARPRHAGRLPGAGRRGELVDEHVEPLTLDDAPDLVVIQVYITNAYRAYALADRYRAAGRSSSLADCT